MKEKFDKMGLEALMKWYESDDSNEAPDDYWREWERQVKTKAPHYFRQLDFCELNTFYRDHPHDDIPTWSDAWMNAVQENWPFEDIFSRLTAIEKSLDVILKKMGSEDAGISVNQLIRLKGGHST